MQPESAQALLVFKNAELAKVWRESLADVGIVNVIVVESPASALPFINQLCEKTKPLDIVITDEDSENFSGEMLEMLKILAAKFPDAILRYILRPENERPVYAKSKYVLPGILSYLGQLPPRVIENNEKADK